MAITYSKKSLCTWTRLRSFCDPNVLGDCGCAVRKCQSFSTTRTDGSLMEIEIRQIHGKEGNCPRFQAAKIDLSSS